MNLLTVLLQLDAPAAQGGGFDPTFWIMMIAVFAIMYFFMIRPQNKKQKEVQRFRNSLEVGQRVITAGGIHGKIKDIQDSEVILEIADNVKIKIDKSSIFASAEPMQATK